MTSDITLILEANEKISEDIESINKIIRETNSALNKFYMHVKIDEEEYMTIGQSKPDFYAKLILTLK